MSAALRLVRWGVYITSFNEVDIKKAYMKLDIYSLPIIEHYSDVYN